MLAHETPIMADKEILGITNWVKAELRRGREAMNFL
jgi:hypothetical protein